MTARDRFLIVAEQAVWGAVFGKEGDYPNIPDLVDTLLREHAHELAEQIRAITITPTDHPSYDDGKEAGLDIAADLIDPDSAP